MDRQDEIMLALGELKGEVGQVKSELAEIRKLSDRVNKLEQWHSYLSGAWAVIATACAGLWAFFIKGTHGH